LRTKLDLRTALATAWGIAVLYAISDEYHQTFVTGRHGSWVDVAIDSMGAALFVVLVIRAKRREVAW
jgi:VanZ family protein